MGQCALQPLELALERAIDHHVAGIDHRAADQRRINRRLDLDLATDGADEELKRFIGLLADNHRLVLLPEIAGLFEQLRAEAEQIVKARVSAASELRAAELESIRAGLKRRFGREVEIETAVDPSLIGGAVIDAGDVVIDGSLRGKLDRLQSALAH